jgi:chromatin segregation and condensation protein Rec8/ScpA/Scc1 (kleisin family)
MSERCVHCGGYRDAQSIFNWSEVDMRCNCQPPYAPKWAEEERARVYISDDLAQEIHDRLLRALSEEEVNRNRAREQRNVPAERYHRKHLLRIERSLQALIEQMEEQRVPSAVNHSSPAELFLP